VTPRLNKMQHNSSVSATAPRVSTSLRKVRKRFSDSAGVPGTSFPAQVPLDSALPCAKSGLFGSAEMFCEKQKFRETMSLRSGAPSMKTKFAGLFLVATLIFVSSSCSAAGKGTVERIKVHGKCLEGNLEGDFAGPGRIHLPARELMPAKKTRHYPVIYMLHASPIVTTSVLALPSHWINLPEVLDKTFGEPGTREMIVVMPTPSRAIRAACTRIQ